eukprot:scaffold207085_cov19-Tisochrysis_lutea.AAC.3
MHTHDSACLQYGEEGLKGGGPGGPGGAHFTHTAGDPFDLFASFFGNMGGGGGGGQRIKVTTSDVCLNYTSLSEVWSSSQCKGNLEGD